LKSFSEELSDPKSESAKERRGGVGADLVRVASELEVVKMNFRDLLGK